MLTLLWRLYQCFELLDSKLEMPHSSEGPGEEIVQRVLAFFEEHQFARHPIPVNRNRFSCRHLIRCQEACQGTN